MFEAPYTVPMILTLGLFAWLTGFVHGRLRERRRVKKILLKAQCQTHDAIVLVRAMEEIDGQVDYHQTRLTKR